MSTPDIPLRLSVQLPRDDWNGVGPSINGGPPNYEGNRIGHFGIDVSHRQRDLDWRAAAATGKCAFAWIKIQEGATWNDPYCIEHLIRATQAGVPSGAYHYARPEADDALDEAHAFVMRYRFIQDQANHPFKLRPWLDFEHRGTTQDASKWLLDWCQYVTQELGTKPIVYTYYNFAGVFDARVGGIDLALADYRRTSTGTEKIVPPFNRRPLVHQFTGTGRIAGYSRDIDRDFAPSLEPLMIEPSTNTSELDRAKSKILELESVLSQWRARHAEMSDLRDKANEYGKKMQAERDEANKRDAQLIEDFEEWQKP